MIAEQYVSQMEVAPICGWPHTSFKDVLSLCRPGPKARRLNRRVWYPIDSICDYLRRVSPEVFDDTLEMRLRQAATNPFLEGNHDDT